MASRPAAGLPSSKRRVVPGLCRSAMEAACMEVVRRRRLKAGEHTGRGDLLADQKTLNKLMALHYLTTGRRGAR